MLATACVLIEVTQADIDAGEQSCCEFCPVARAISRVLGQQVYVTPPEVGLDFLWTKPLALPPGVAEWIEAFDDGAGVKPFSFYLDVPEMEFTDDC